jgi:hypothetical protein
MICRTYWTRPLGKDSIPFTETRKHLEEPSSKDSKEFIMDVQVEPEDFMIPKKAATRKLAKDDPCIFRRAKARFH